MGYVPEKELDKLESLRLWLYEKLNQFADTQNVVEKGMYKAYEECLKMVESLYGRK